MFCKNMSFANWQNNQSLYEAEADYMIDKERIKNKEYRFLFRFLKRAIRFFLVKIF
ncbi:MAG: hypothetical protein P1P59_03220 [Treponemataceae bacterium]